MTNMHKPPFPDDDWENGKLGQDETFVRKASEESDALVDTGLGLKVISIRLQEELIQELKTLAKKEGLNYQPFIRQILTKFVNEHSVESESITEEPTLFR
ncbi:CopG family antitoxin [Legionella yabuuchiae]|uniref:CopG family antitoxin n=1 Tax=Legionella yabuuchiae TaxID=376727 RepID=UPI0010556638|nr:CopG family antitoxin [Legionella yabuuchiae]